ncbi:unnamed protein product, partial [Symbiodinium sp. KB8]
LYRSDQQDEDLEKLHSTLQALDEGDITNDSSVLEFLQGSKVSERVLGLAEAGYGNTQGSALKDLSIKALEHFERCWTKDGEEGDFRLPGGMDQVIKAMASGLNIKTNHAVDRIAVEGDGVRVNCTNGASFLAAKVIVTVTITVS